MSRISFGNVEYLGETCSSAVVEFIELTEWKELYVDRTAGFVDGRWLEYGRPNAILEHFITHLPDNTTIEVDGCFGH